jgi:hypothetical protein
MKTWIARPRSAATQKTAAFTGEGAYHGSTKPRPAPPPGAAPPAVPEATASTLDRYEREGRTKIEDFDAHFPNEYRLLARLPAPTQEEIQRDEVTFCWCPLDTALHEAGPLTRQVLEAMRHHVTGRKRFVYIDSKIQHFNEGDLPVDSRLWHVDGSIAVRDHRAQRLGHKILHDLRARQEHDDPPRYLAYQSSTHCATQFLDRPLTLRLPELIPDFDGMDAAVRAADPPAIAQPPASIVAFDGLSLHRAVPASASGWRLWVRCTETDREIRIDPSILDCYGTVFRP